jgi:hypothetical protein
MLYKTIWVLDKILSLLIIAVMITSDLPQRSGQYDKVHTYTSAAEFDYPTWVWNAIWSKIGQSAVSAPYIFDQGSNKQIVFEYLHTTGQLAQTDTQIEKIFSDPKVTDKEAGTAYLRAQRDQLTAKQAALAPFAESVLQSQINNTLAELGLTTGGQTIPPLLYHNTPTPLALIVSPRGHIEQSTNISLLPSLTLDQQIKLEDDIAKSLNVSTLVVPTGGIGVYPTMVMETTDLNWMLSTISHEWTHNYLNLRPLGINYGTTPELRTMNETTASISGDEVGHAVLQKYYPELLASNPSRNLVQLNLSFLPAAGLGDTPPFDFRAEMHTTRVHVDELLKQGKIDEAESYMEQRRQIFVQNGYIIRKLNQAYFAFYGAYADVPGGAAGEDPVGPAVRALRAQSKSLADFINTISWMTSFKQLQKAIQK